MNPQNTDPSFDFEQSKTTQDLTFFEKMKDLKTSARSEFRDTNIYGKAVLLSLGAMTFYEWGPGNEALTPYIGAKAVDVSDGLKGVAITMGITGGFTVAQQLASSWLTRRTVQQFPNVATKAFNYMNNEAEITEDLKYKEFDDLPLSKKGLYPFTIGTSFVVAREAFVTGNTEEEKLKNVGRKSAAIVGGSVALLAGSLDVIDQAVPDGTIWQSAFNILKTPYPYVAAVFGILGKDYLKSRKHKKQKNEEKNGPSG